MKYPQVCDYVPVPQPVTTDRMIAAHYYPGWKKGKSGMHNGFDDLREYPERIPMAGFYDESSPEHADWEIKWAVEHGIGCFIYCWYRYKSNLNQPVTRDGLRLSYALHDGFLRARYRNMMKFALMFECQTSRWGAADGPQDFLENVLPFWIENYFRRENYLRLKNGKVMLFIYSYQDFINSIGGPEICAETLAKAREIMQKEGFPGIHFSVMHGEDTDYSLARKAGFESAFEYCIFMKEKFLTEAQYAEYRKTLAVPEDVVVREELKYIQERIDKASDFFIFINSVMRDSHPWYKLPWFDRESILHEPLQFKLSPEKWKEVLTGTKKKLTQLPADSIGNELFIIDNWNEYSEGHYVAPTRGSGFRYLQAIREVLTHCDNIPDYRTPDILGLGPYDQEYNG